MLDPLWQTLVIHIDWDKNLQKLGNFDLIQEIEQLVAKQKNRFDKTGLYKHIYISDCVTEIDPINNLLSVKINPQT